MAEHSCEVQWTRDDARDSAATFTGNRYSRAHTWTFDGGAPIAASSSPHVVRVPMSDVAAVDPEEAFVAGAPPGAAVQRREHPDAAAVDAIGLDRLYSTSSTVTA